MLPFEDAYQLDGTACRSCAGAGVIVIATREKPSTCRICSGLGRKISAAGHRVYRHICELLGNPVAPHQRLEPKHLDSISAHMVRRGMLVRGWAGDEGRGFRFVTAVASLGERGMAIDLLDGSTAIVSHSNARLERRLSPLEIDEAQKAMSRWLGRGAVIATAGFDAR